MIPRSASRTVYRMSNPQKTHDRIRSFGYLIRTLSRQVHSEMQAALKEVGLNSGQFATLITLLDGEGISQTELAAKVGVPGYATTRTLDSLEALGFTIRKPDPASRRTHRIYLTAKGRRKAKTLPGIVTRVNASFLRQLSSADQKELVRLLQLLRLA